MHPLYLPPDSTFNGLPGREPHDEDDLRYGLADIQRGLRILRATPWEPRPRPRRAPRGRREELERLV